MTAEGARLARGCAPPWALVVALVAVPPAAVAQTIEGRVDDAGNGRPVANALLRLVDGSGDALVATAADSVGRYRLTAPGPGRYRIEAEQLGYEAYRSGPVDVQDASEVRRVDVTLQPSPIPIGGMEVSTDVVNRRLRQVLGISPGQLRIRPIRSGTIRDHAERGDDLSEMMIWQRIPNLQVLRTREGPCYQFRGRGCLPVYLDGARVNRSSISMLPLEILSTVVVLLPNEVIAYPSGAVHLYSIGFMR